MQKKMTKIVQKKPLLKRGEKNRIQVEESVANKIYEEYLKALLHNHEASFYLLEENPIMPHIMIIHKGLCYFIDMPGNKQVSQAKLENMNKLEKSGAKVVICRSMEALILTLQHWNLPIGFKILEKL